VPVVHFGILCVISLENLCTASYIGTSTPSTTFVASDLGYLSSLSLLLTALDCSKLFLSPATLHSAFPFSFCISYIDLTLEFLLSLFDFKMFGPNAKKWALEVGKVLVARRWMAILLVLVVFAGG